MNKFYKTYIGVWINLSLCHRFYIETIERGKYGEDIYIMAVLDITDEEEIEYILEGPFDNEEAAQQKLDEIMRV